MTLFLQSKEVKGAPRNLQLKLEKLIELVIVSPTVVSSFQLSSASSLGSPCSVSQWSSCQLAGGKRQRKPLYVCKVLRLQVFLTCNLLVRCNVNIIRSENTYFTVFLWEEARQQAGSRQYALKNKMQCIIGKYILKYIIHFLLVSPNVSKI